MATPSLALGQSVPSGGELGARPTDHESVRLAVGSGSPVPRVLPRAEYLGELVPPSFSKNAQAVVEGRLGQRRARAPEVVAASQWPGLSPWE